VGAGGRATLSIRLTRLQPRGPPRPIILYNMEINKNKIVYYCLKLEA